VPVKKEYAPLQGKKTPKDGVTLPGSAATEKRCEGSAPTLKKFRKEGGAPSLLGKKKEMPEQGENHP